MSLPQVVIVGRPNVGKSSLFNWLSGRRIAITDATAGVTRDRLGHLIHLEDARGGDRYFELVDTGGIGFVDPDNLTEHIDEQIQVAIDSATLVLFLVDVRDGLVSSDWEIDTRLRQVNKPVLLVANKCDAEKFDPIADEFYAFGRDPVIKVSAQQNRGRKELVKAILRHLPEPTAEEGPQEEPAMKLAIVGRRNVGKSTFINTLAGQERVITSEVAGTTRDSIDVRFELDGLSLVAIDTPGLRRRKSINSNVDFYGTHRAQRSVRRADVVLLFFDPREGVSRVEKQLADYIAEQYKPCIFVVNKWDLYAEEIETGRYADYLRETFPTLWNVPVAFITGQTGRNVKKLLNHAQMLFKQSRSRIGTSELNRLVQAAVDRNPPPLMKGHHRPKVYYATQVGVQPPTIVLFVNTPSAFAEPYRRYLLGFFRDQLEFGEVPIKIYYRQRTSEAPGKPRSSQDAADEHWLTVEPPTDEAIVYDLGGED